MGAYKGRVNLKQRRSRSAKAKRIKALAATTKESLRTPAASNKGMSPEGKNIKPGEHDIDTKDLGSDKTEGDELAAEDDAEEA
jgi:hypothetical protein